MGRRTDTTNHLGPQSPKLSMHICFRALTLSVLIAACGTASPSPSSVGPSTAPSTTASTPDPRGSGMDRAVRMVRFEIRGRRYEANLSASPATLGVCASTDPTPCQAPAQRGLVGAHIDRMAARARDESCPPGVSGGDLVRLEIDGQVTEVRLATNAVDHEYVPPTGETYQECAPRTLVRSLVAISTWE